MESMTNAPHLLNGSRTGIKYGSTEMLDHMAWDGLTNPDDGKAMGVFGAAACAKYDFSREDVDAYSTERANRPKQAIPDRHVRAHIFTGATTPHTGHRRVKTT